LTNAWFQRVKVTHHEPPTIFTFKFNVRRYTVEQAFDARLQKMEKELLAAYGSSNPNAAGLR
jgi:hypothetical protein